MHVARREWRQIVKGAILGGFFTVVGWLTGGVGDNIILTIATIIGGFLIAGTAICFVEVVIGNRTAYLVQNIVVKSAALFQPASLIQKIVVKSAVPTLAVAVGVGILGLCLLLHLGHREAVPWILLGCGIWGGMDATLTLLRLAKGDYGDADYELRELAGPLVARIARGHDPGDPDRLFPERRNERPMIDEVEEPATA